MRKSIIEKDIDGYLKKVKQYIFCNKKTKSKIKEDIESSVYDYAELDGISNISEVYDKFGSPEELAKAYLSQEKPVKVKKAISIRKIFSIGFLATLIIIMLFYIICAVMVRMSPTTKTYHIEEGKETTVEIGEW